MITVETEVRLILLYEYKLDLKVTRKINAVLMKMSFLSRRPKFGFQNLERETSLSKTRLGKGGQKLLMKRNWGGLNLDLFRGSF